MIDPYKYRNKKGIYDSQESFNHTLWMTRFDLHAKNEIAHELAGRDIRIAELEGKLAEAKSKLRWREWPDEKPEPYTRCLVQVPKQGTLSLRLAYYTVAWVGYPSWESRKLRWIPIPTTETGEG